MLLQEKDGVFHWAYQSQSMLFDLANVSEMRHDLREKLLFFFVFSLLWDNLDSLVNFFNEGLRVRDASDGVSE